MDITGGSPTGGYLFHFGGRLRVGVKSPGDKDGRIDSLSAGEWIRIALGSELSNRLIRRGRIQLGSAGVVRVTLSRAGVTVGEGLLTSAATPAQFSLPPAQGLYDEIRIEGVSGLVGLKGALRVFALELAERALAPPEPNVATSVVRGAVDLRVGPIPVSDAAEGTVSLHVDRNRDGRVDPSEQVSTALAPDRTFRLEWRSNTSERVVLTAKVNGATAAIRYSPAIQVFNLPTSVEVDLGSIAVQQLQRVDGLSCSAGWCSAPDGNASLEVPPGSASTGWVRAFDPTLPLSAFPGSFEDTDGNLLVSGGFAWLELLDTLGTPVKTLSQPATLRLRLSESSQQNTIDVVSGTGLIEVPLYSFDEVAGLWRREGVGLLTTEGDVPVPESQLAQVKRGQLTRLFVRGAISHLSYWNIDWPVETRGCVRGRLLDAEDRPVLGGVVRLSGRTYAGWLEPTVPDAQGRFCAELLRSELSSEDLDQDGRIGELHQVDLSYSDASGRTLGQTISAPSMAGACGNTCLDLGDLRVEPEAWRSCAISGQVTDRSGAPLAGVSLFGTEATAGTPGVCSTCNTVSDATGGFSLIVPVIREIRITGESVQNGVSPIMLTSRVGVGTWLG